MKVLKKGRSQSGWSVESTCDGAGNGLGGCGAKLLIEQKDLFKTSSHPYGDDSPTYYATFKCAACGVLTDLEYETVPRHVWDKLPKRNP